MLETHCPNPPAVQNLPTFPYLGFYSFWPGIYYLLLQGKGTFIYYWRGKGFFFKVNHRCTLLLLIEGQGFAKFINGGKRDFFFKSTKSCVHGLLFWEDLVGPYKGRLFWGS